MLETAELLRQFTQAVAVLERGHYPPTPSDRARAIQTLEGEICSGPWPSADERVKAQVLISRLRKLKDSGSFPAVHGPKPHLAEKSLPEPVPAVAAVILKRRRSKRERG